MSIKRTLLLVHVDNKQWCLLIYLGSINISEGRSHIDNKMLDSRYANGFLVHLLSGCLALDDNLVKSLSILFSLMSTNVDTLGRDKWGSVGYDYSGGY